jgi:N-acetylglucosaminyl-diphospho-decaprenol L-rhamnosyltransferase
VNAEITISVVSHRQNELVNQLVGDIDSRCTLPFALVITQNVHGAVPIANSSRASFSKIITNAQPKGFGANHNAAFRDCLTRYFCVLNPDVRLTSDPFPQLIDTLRSNNAGAVGPLVRNPSGGIEDSARQFPTLTRLVRKLFSRSPQLYYGTDTGPVSVDWIAGMFMLFPAEVYRSIGGFDERYFLYYEDVDLCRRLWKSGRPVIYEPRVDCIHDARRSSRRNLYLAVHHLMGAIRFLSRR